MSAIQSIDGFESLHWLSRLMQCGSTSNIRDSFGGGGGIKKSGATRDDVAGCLAYIYQQSKHKHGQMVRLIVEHYIDYEYHNHFITQAGTKKIQHSNIDTIKAAKIALERATNAKACCCSADMIILAYDLDITRQAYNRNWKKQVSKVTSYYYGLLGIGDMYAREYRKRWYAA